MNSPVEIGRRIREAREAARLSQQDLGRRLSPARSHAAISDMERGVTRPSAQDIAQLAEILGVNVLFFYGESGPPQAPQRAVYRRGNAAPSPETIKAIESFREVARRIAQQRKGQP